MIELIGALATWRLARMVATEHGPFNLFSLLRARTAILPDPWGWIGDGFSCVACLSFWFGLGVSAALGGGDAGWIILRGLAFSAVAVLLYRR